MQNAAPADGGRFLSLRIKYGCWKYGFFGAGNTRSGFRPVWYELDKLQKGQAVEQIARYIKALRALKPTSMQSNRVSATNGDPCRDVRVSTMNLFGPFDDVTAFHRCLTGITTNPDAVTEAYGDAVFNVHARSYNVRFTHGDLGAQNILIRDSKVAAIIDWECSGWWPEYWEYTKAHYNEWRCPPFYEMLRERISRSRYDEELTAERELWEAFNRPLNKKGWNAP
ncbi:hypothetical protein B0A48_14041 [Cryoendolithus antarcticus]|uniref:Aminoglycoside phosphotransferase domain-containing protein n=1 Tax=Cryoendolithus antarcticus TaxID=1507870 RepID=A0A1V8SMF1_9PEZI|nr:hypothetical protein B0A48_14041 [Cryoendolithus antarcticus]